MAPTHVRPDDVRGYAQLAVDATLRVTDLVEAMHQRIGQPAWLYGERGERTLGITGLVYRSIREVAGAIGAGLDQAMQPLTALLERAVADTANTAEREALVAAINGVLGDHLEQRRNPLALPMTLRHAHRGLVLEREALASAVAQPRNHLLILVHGLCMNDLQWSRQGYDHADELALLLKASTLHLRYNSGRHISQNGRAFAQQLEQLLHAWPVRVERITLLVHSMGGLVARSACHYGAQAGHQWLPRLRDLVFLGTPHHGAPLERGGNHLQHAVGLIPFAGPLARLGMLRSAGVTDLRHGALLDQDWQGRDRFADHHDTRLALPLPAGVRCFAAAATLGAARGDLKDGLLGDGLVPVASAFGEHADPARALHLPASQRALFTESSHWDLLYRRDVGEQIQRWLSHY